MIFQLRFDRKFKMVHLSNRLKMTKNITLGIFFLLISCFAQTKFSKLSGSYFGQKPPISKVEIFLDQIISTQNAPEMCAAFSPDGKEFYFNALKDKRWTIFFTHEVNGEWTLPEPLSFSSDYGHRDFTISPDGKKLFFGSDRPSIMGGERLNSLDIYVSEKVGPAKWSDPKNLGGPVNTDNMENYPSVDSAGNLYFFSNRKEGLGGCEIYMAEFKEGIYLAPVLLGENINSNKNDWDSFVAPDGSYLIFSSKNRDDSIGKNDIYISFRDLNNKWKKAINMGPKVNSEADEICPSVSADGNIFFFTSRRRGKADILWIDAKIIEELKMKENNVGN